MDDEDVEATAEAVVDADAATDDEALGNPKAPKVAAADEGEDADNEGETSGAAEEAVVEEVGPPVAMAWRLLLPEGLAEEEDFLEVFSFMTEAAAEAWRDAEPLPA